MFIKLLNGDQMLTWKYGSGPSLLLEVISPITVGRRFFY